MLHFKYFLSLLMIGTSGLLVAEELANKTQLQTEVQTALLTKVQIEPTVEEMVIQDDKAEAYCKNSQFSKKYVLDKINQIRTKGASCGGKRLPAVGKVTWNDKLALAARNHSVDMATNRFLDHKGSDGSYPEKRVEKVGYEWQFITENVASGTLSVADTLKSFNDSVYHCENLMSPKVKEVGLACAYTASDFQKFYWTQVFAK